MYKNIKLQNLNIGTTAFHGFCYNKRINNRGLDNEIGKCLLFIVLRSQKPFQLMAWKFWPLTITSFSQVLLEK